MCSYIFVWIGFVGRWGSWGFVCKFVVCERVVRCDEAFGVVILGWRVLV